jgi:uncharacterized protein (TIGR02145 family)
MVGCNNGGETPEERTKTIAVTGVGLDKTTIALVEEDTATLTATVTPETASNKAVTWSSDDSTIATVDENGLVTAVKAGSATITVTTDDGEMTADCEVTVAAKVIEVTGVTLNKSTLLLLALEATETLTATVTPETATDKAVTWSSDDSTIATVDENGLITAVKAGSATITVTTADGSYTADCAVTVQGVLINGIVWASANVDAPGTFAAKPEDFGMFYQWGKNVGWSATDPLTSSNDDTTWDESSFSGEEWTSANDPCPDGWQVPSLADIEALTDESKVTNTWTKQDGVNGRLFVDQKTEKSIFLPAAGERVYSSSDLAAVGSSGIYWSGTPGSATTGYYLLVGAWRVEFSIDTYRNHGLAVRCVRSE